MVTTWNSVDTNQSSVIPNVIETLSRKPRLLETKLVLSDNLPRPLLSLIGTNQLKISLIHYWSQRTPITYCSATSTKESGMVPACRGKIVLEVPTVV